MKKLYTFALCTLLAAGALAQTTLTSAAMPQVGYVYTLASDTTPADLATFTVSAGSASAQSWNYTSEFANIYGESVTFVTASSGAGSSNFPNATLAVQQASGDWAYFVGNTAGLYIDGAYVNFQGTFVPIDVSPNSLVMATPSTYGFSNNATSTATSTASIGGNTYQVRHYADRTVTADAFGSLTIPTGNFPNTLRVKTYEITNDSIFVDVFGSWALFTTFQDTSTTYTWYQNAPDAQLMEIQMDASNAVTKAQYLQSFSNGIAQVAKANGPLSVYPNPVSDIAYLTYENKTSGRVSLAMYDMNGRQVATLFNQDQAIGSQKVHLDVQNLHLPQGIYFLRLQNNEGLQTIRIAIN